jgi:hypothetical protein
MAEGAKVWIEDAGADVAASRVRAVLSHSDKAMSVAEADLGQLATEMPKVFEDCTWVHRRHEMRLRADGARVGLIEGDCNHDVDLGAFGLPAQKLEERKLQLMFPDDTGTSIVTASYPVDQAPKWQPLFEASIGKATGVATRVPAPTPATQGGWAVAGVVLGWFASALLRPRKRDDDVDAERA